MNAPFRPWRSDPAAIALAEIEERGFAILRRAVAPAEAAALSADLDSRFRRIGLCDGPFFGRGTRRFQALLSRSPRSAAFALHETVLAIVERILLRSCDRIQLNLTQAIQIEPGERAQVPHRDQSIWPRTIPGVEYMVNAMWPLTKFTAENGGTRLWPGSHVEPDLRRPDLDAAVAAEMEPGDVLIYLGSLIHAGGANRSAAPRRGMVMSYSLGWLKPAENMSLTYPPAVARAFPRRLAQLVGYECQPGNLGSYDGQCPSLLLDGRYDEFLGAREVMPAAHQPMLEHFARTQEWG